jgi:acetyl esterase/lipase
MRILAIVLVVLSSVLAACSPFAAVNLLVPRGGYDRHEGLAYGADPRQRLDIYVPQGLKRPAPVLLFFYGGSWQSGARGNYRAFGQAFASRGIITVVADYRLYPQVTYPAFVEDAAAALAFVHAHAADYGGDPARLFVAGHSAGAYNAVMLASDPRWLRAEGGSPGWIRGVIGIAGPYDFLPLRDAVYIAIFHGANNPDTMPIRHIDGPRPPMLLATGTADATVGPGNSERMAARLRVFGSPVRVVRYPGIGHVGIILSLVPGFRWLAPLRQDMTAFILGH